MKTYINSWLGLSIIAGAALLSSCGEDDPEPEPEVTYTIPTTYNFTDANGNSTVDFSGQLARLEMLDEMVAEMKTGNESGVVVSAAVLKDMFSNTNSPFSNADLNTTTKQLYNKTLSPETFVSFFDSLSKASESTVLASNGVAGVVQSGTNSFLVSANGLEYTQIIEKGLFASLEFYQISNNYLTADKIGPSVSTALESGENYNAKEHHFDEAFGYFGAKTDFPSSAGDDIAKYSNVVDQILGTNIKIMRGFLKGRAAIVNNDNVALAEAVEVINSSIELVFAGAAIHYLNGTLENIGDDALRSHELSEAWGFLGGLSISPSAKSSVSEVEAWKNTIGYNFWDVSPVNLSNVRDAIASKYGISIIQRDAL